MQALQTELHLAEERRRSLQDRLDTSKSAAEQLAKSLELTNAMCAEMAEAAHDLREELRNAVSRADESERETARLQALLASMPAVPAASARCTVRTGVAEWKQSLLARLSARRFTSYSLSFIRAIIRRPGAARLHLKAWSKARIIQVFRIVR